MARIQNGLGRDFYSLLDDNSIDVKSESLTSLRVNLLDPRKDQPRKTFDQEDLQLLADSISEHGVIQPIVVREIEGTDRYEIIAGERRWRAAKMAGISEVPVVIMDSDDMKTSEIALIENVQRQDLNPVEEALGYRSLMEDYGLTQEEAAGRVGKSRPAVANALRLLSLPKSVEALLRGDLLTSVRSNPVVVWGLVLCIWQYVRMVRSCIRRDLACFRIPSWSWISLIVVILGVFVVRNLLLIFTGYDYLGDNASFWAYVMAR